jgi:hypothetical protein
MRLGAANARRKRRPIVAKTIEAHRSGVDQAKAIAGFAPEAPLQLLHQRRKNPAEDRNRTRRIGLSQSRTRNRPHPKMVKLADMAAQRRFDLPQTLSIGRIAHAGQMRLGTQRARIVAAMLFHKAVMAPNGRYFVSS